MSYAPLFNEFETMLRVLYINDIELSEDKRKMLRIAFMSGAHALAILSAEGKLQAAMDELDDYMIELERGI